MEKMYYFYILADGFCGTLYTGITNDMERRMYEHREGLVEGFTKKYGIKQLVYYERYEHILDAIQREKKVKKWNRRWKIELVRKSNPRWKDLSGNRLLN